MLITQLACFFYGYIDPYSNTLRLFPVRVVLNCFSGEAAGPLSTAPFVLNAEP